MASAKTICSKIGLTFPQDPASRRVEPERPPFKLPPLPYPQDGLAHYYLGNLLYDKKRYTEAISHWETTTQLAPSFSIPWRNLGIASYNVLRDLDRARACYERACEANPQDARLLYESDHLARADHDRDRNR